MKKKIVRLLLALMCVLALTGCKDKTEATEPSETQKPDHDVEIDIGDLLG